MFHQLYLRTGARFFFPGNSERMLTFQILGVQSQYIFETCDQFSHMTSTLSIKVNKY